MKTRTAAVLALAALALGCQNGRREARAVLDRLASDEFDPPASTITAYRVALDTDPEVQQLVWSEMGAPEALDRLKRDVTGVGDKVAAVCSYVIEKRAYKTAIPTLEAYLNSDPGSRHHTWGPSFAVRALLKLKDIPDGSGGYEEYDDETIRKSILGP